MSSLCELPDEVILHILSFLPSRYQILSITRVCQRFNHLVTSKWYWRARFVHLCGSHPARELENIRLWQEGCVQSEFAVAAANGALNSHLLAGTLGGIDCVHILHSDMHGASTVVAAGSRDTAVYICRQRPQASDTRNMRAYTMAKLPGHNGWVWSLASERDHRPHLLCSGSWDHSVKVWDVSAGMCATTISNVHRAAVLSLCIPQRDCLISGCQDKKVRVMDLRTPVPLQAEHRLHHRSVLSVCASEDYIYSAGEDKKVYVWDRRVTKLMQKLSFTGIIPTLHLDYNMLSLATSTEVRSEGDEVVGRVHEVYLYDCSRGTLEEHTHFDSGHSQPMTRVLHCLGMIVTASKDGSVKIHSPGSTHHLLSVLDQQDNAITDMDFSRNSLLVARGERNMVIWTQQYR